MVKNSKKHNIIIIIIILFREVFYVSVSSTQRQIFVSARVSDIMQFENMLQKCFNCSYRGSTSLPTRIIESSTHWALPILHAQNSNRNTRKCVQSYIKDTKKTSNDAVLVSSLLTLYIALVNSIEFEQLNAG